jgi:predicted GTPase
LPEKKKKSIEEIKKNDQQTVRRNILIIGRTGNGKSTLANVLTNREELRRKKVTKKFEEEDNKCHECGQKFVEGKDKEGKYNK